jgi:hypothetical protein
MPAPHVLTVLYGLTGFVSLAGYVPQFIAFRRDMKACHSTPVATWLLWFIQAVVVEAYAVLVNGDTMFILSASMSLAAIAACTAMLLWGRRKLQGAPPTNIVPFTPTPTVPPVPTMPPAGPDKVAA